jgi:hypothetical protein
LTPKVLIGKQDFFFNKKFYLVACFSKKYSDDGKISPLPVSTVSISNRDISGSNKVQGPLSAKEPSCRIFKIIVEGIVLVK